MIWPTFFDWNGGTMPTLEQEITLARVEIEQHERTIRVIGGEWESRQPRGDEVRRYLDARSNLPYARARLAELEAQQSSSSMS